VHTCILMVLPGRCSAISPASASHSHGSAAPLEFGGPESSNSGDGKLLASAVSFCMCHMVTNSFSRAFQMF
jgi:hypothetical protein